MENVLTVYPELEMNSNGERISTGGIESRVRRCKHDYAKELKTGEPINVTYGGSTSFLGDELDSQLRIKVHNHVAKGVPVNDSILKAITKKLLRENKKEYLLAENGGTVKLGKSWWGAEFFTLASVC